MNAFQEHFQDIDFRMNALILTAALVGGSTVFGGAVGLVFKRTTKTFTDAVLSFAAGVMLAAAFIGLIMPSIEYGGVFKAVIGIFIGAFTVNFLDMLVPLITAGQKKVNDDRLRRVFLFVMAIALHNLPEGIAAGVGFGSGDTGNALLIALGIALQNIPEGMVIIAPMLSVGIPARRTFLLASATGFVEVVGTMLGYFAVSFASFILPFALSFAGGTMLYVISDDLIPEVHADGKAGFSTIAMITGFCLMLLMSYLL